MRAPERDVHRRVLEVHGFAGVEPPQDQGRRHLYVVPQDREFDAHRLRTRADRHVDPQGLEGKVPVLDDHDEGLDGGGQWPEHPEDEILEGVQRDARDLPEGPHDLGVHHPPDEVEERLDEPVDHVEDAVHDGAEKAVPEPADDLDDLRPRVPGEGRGGAVRDALKRPARVDGDREGEVEEHVHGSDLGHVSRWTESDPAGAHRIDVEQAQHAEVPAGLERAARHFMDVRPMDVRRRAVPEDRSRVAEPHPQVPRLRTERIPRLRVAEVGDPEDRRGLPDDDRLEADPMIRDGGGTVPRPELKGALRGRDEDLHVPHVVRGREIGGERADQVAGRDEEARRPDDRLDEPAVYPALRWRRRCRGRAEVDSLKAGEVVSLRIGVRERDPGSTRFLLDLTPKVRQGLEVEEPIVRVPRRHDLQMEGELRPRNRDLVPTRDEDVVIRPKEVDHTPHRGRLGLPQVRDEGVDVRRVLPHPSDRVVDRGRQRPLHEIGNGHRVLWVDPAAQVGVRDRADQVQVVRDRRRQVREELPCGRMDGLQVFREQRVVVCPPHVVVAGEEGDILELDGCFVGGDRDRVGGPVPVRDRVRAFRDRHGRGPEERQRLPRHPEELAHERADQVRLPSPALDPGEEVVDADREGLRPPHTDVETRLEPEVLEHSQHVLVDDPGQGLREDSVQADGVGVERAVQRKQVRGVRGPALRVRIEEADDRAPRSIGDPWVPEVPPRELRKEC